MNTDKENLITPEQKKSVLLEILQTVDVFCTENDVKYSLAYGTLLGAVRHNGFIPWDDDIDIIMLRDEYDRFVQLFLQSPPQNYKCITFENGSYYLPYTKIVDTRTHVIAENFVELDDLGICVDVFPFDYISDDRKKAVKIKGCAKLNSKLIRYTSYNNLKEVCNGKLRIDKAVLYYISKGIGFHKLSSIYKERIIRLNNNAKWVGYLGECYESNENVFESEIIKKTVLGEFEGRCFPITENFDSVLSRMYGDYMCPPPVEERESHTEKAFFINK